MRPTLENLELRDRFLTRSGRFRFGKATGGMPETKIDPFTLTENFPKAFRVGDCVVVSPEQEVRFQLLLFWKDDVRSEERSVTVTAKNEEGSWRIDSVD
jgi:hypothetical protein